MSKYPHGEKLDQAVIGTLSLAVQASSESRIAALLGMSRGTLHNALLGKPLGRTTRNYITSKASEMKMQLTNIQRMKP